MTIEQQIQEFLNGLPNIDERAARRALIVSANLDEALRQQIDCDLPLAQWTPLVVDMLSPYGTLADGRDAMIAVLETAKTLVGVQKQAICDDLIQQWQRHSSSPARSLKDNRKCPITYSLRPQVRHFFDRNDILAQLVAELRDAQKVMVMIDGIAGIGKTSLAVKVTEAVESEFAGVYYKKCAPDTDAEQLLAEFAYFLSEHNDHLLAGVFEYGAQQEYKVKALIEALAKQRYLLLLDDVHELLSPQTQTIVKSDLDALFTSLLTQPHQSKILLASRVRPIFLQAQMGQVKNQLGPIEQQAGIEFLRQIRIEDDPNLLQQAYEFTGGHPLTMELLAALTETMPLEDILSDRRLFWSDSIVADKLLQKIYKTLTPEEQTLILKISILPRPVSNKVICALNESPNTMQLLQALVRKSLVMYDQKSKLYRLHDLVRDFHYSQLSNQQKKDYHLKAAAYYERLEFNKDKPTFDQVQNRLEARYYYFQVEENEKAAHLLLDVSESIREWRFLQQDRTLLIETLLKFDTLSPNSQRQLLKVDLLIELSWVEHRSEGTDEALHWCHQAEDILKRSEDQTRWGKLYHIIGRVYFHKGLWQEADHYLSLAFEIKKQGKDTKGLILVFDALKDLYAPSNLGANEQIDLKKSEALEICDQQQDLESRSAIFLIWGIALENQSQFQEAHLMFEKSLSSRPAHNLIGRSHSLRCMARVLRKSQAYEKALETDAVSLRIAQQSGDLLSQAHILRDMGDTYGVQGRIEDAIKKYEEVGELVEHSPNLVGKTYFLLAIARSYRKIGKFEEALAQFERGLQLQKEFNDLVGISYTLSQLGVIYTDSLSDLNTGLKYHQECLNVTKGLKRPVYAELSMEAIAKIYKMQGKIDQALEMFQEILDSRTKRRACNRASVLTQIGSIHYLKGDLVKALEFYRESLQLCEKAKLLEYKAEALNYLGEVYIALGNYEDALASLEESLCLKEKPFDKAEPLTDIADVYYHQGKLAEAMAKCEESLALSRTYGGRIQAGVTLHLMGKIGLQEQRYADALPYVQEAVTIFRETGSRHLPEAEQTLKYIHAEIEHG